MKSDLWCGVALFGTIAVLSGCGRFAFYPDEKMKENEIGVPLYPQKAYLLVSRVGGQQKPVEISVIYLPDLKRPYYARPISGLGSSDLSLKIESGALKEMG